MPWRGIGLPDRAGCLTFDMAGQFHRESKAWDQARNAQGFDEGTLPSTRHEAADRRRGRRDRHPHPCGGIARSVAAMDRQRIPAASVGERGRVNAASCFSGLGAPELGGPQFQWLWHAEIEKFPAAVMAARFPDSVNLGDVTRSEEHTSELQSLMRISYAVFCLKKKKNDQIAYTIMLL